MSYKENVKKLIDNYNAWVQKQKSNYIAAESTECPYYNVNLATPQKFTLEHKKIFENLLKKPVTQNSPWDLWHEILSQGDYKIKIKTQAIRGIDFKINKNLYSRLRDAESLFRFCRDKGLDLPLSHFNWALEQNLIRPIKIIKGEKLYSIYQLMTADRIVKLKKESLEFPDSTFFHGRQIKDGKELIDSPGLIKTESVYWQDHILLNKERIINYGADLKPLILLLEAIDNLDYLVWHKAMEEFYKLKRKYPEEKRYKPEDMLQGIKDKAFSYYLPRFKSKFKKLPIKNIEGWSYNILPAIAIHHNPLLQSCNKWPTLLKIFETEENTVQTIFKKGNDIKLANFYINIIRKLNDYLKIAGVKDISRIEDLVSRTSINKEKKCHICSEAFMPNLERNGGKQQILCGKLNCKKEWDKMRQKKYRDKKR